MREIASSFNQQLTQTVDTQLLGPCPSRRALTLTINSGILFVKFGQSAQGQFGIRLFAAITPFTFDRSNVGEAIAVDVHVSTNLNGRVVGVLEIKEQDD